MTTRINTIAAGLAALSALTVTSCATAQPAPLAKASATTEERLQLLLDREEIGLVLTNYALSFDARDWELQRSVFTDEVEMDFSASIGDGLATMMADDWVAGVRPFFEALEATQHIAMPLSIEVDGDEAYARSMLHAQHYLPNEQGAPVQTMVGHYDNWLVRTEEGWKVRKMVQHVSWNEGNWYVFEKAAGLSD